MAAVLRVAARELARCTSLGIERSKRITKTKWRCQSSLHVAYLLRLNLASWLVSNTSPVNASIFAKGMEGPRPPLTLRTSYVCICSLTTSATSCQTSPFFDHMSFAIATASSREIAGRGSMRRSRSTLSVPRRSGSPANRQVRQLQRAMSVPVISSSEYGHCACQPCNSQVHFRPIRWYQDTLNHLYCERQGLSHNMDPLHDHVLTSNRLLLPFR